MKLVEGVANGSNIKPGSSSPSSLVPFATPFLRFMGGK